MPLAVRHAHPADIPELVRLAARTFPLACPPGLPRSAIESFIADNLDEHSFRSYLDDPGHTVLAGVATNGDPDPSRGSNGAERVVAYALMVDGTSMSEDCAGMISGRPTTGVSKFYVDPDVHGSGAARELLAACIEAARDRGAVSLWLATNVGNARARAFYAKNGFVERGHRTFTVGGTDNDDVVLELPL